MQGSHQSEGVFCGFCTGFNSGPQQQLTRSIGNQVEALIHQDGGPVVPVDGCVVQLQSQGLPQYRCHGTVVTQGGQQR